jgi:hypothetical protein
MKTLIVISTLFAFFSCISKPTAKREIHISEFGWTFQLPLEIKLRDTAFDAKGKITQSFQQAGTAESIDLFTIRDDSTNWFKSLAIKDSVNFYNWEQYHEADNKWYFGQIAQNPRIKILDTTYTTENIDNVSFKKEHIKYYSQKRNAIIWDYHYFGRFKRYELAINFTYTDTLIGKRYFEILRSSRFRR